MQTVEQATATAHIFGGTRGALLATQAQAGVDVSLRVVTHPFRLVASTISIRIGAVCR